MSCDSWPSLLEVNRRGRTLDLVWDGVPASVAHAALRAACRCTECESARRYLRPPLVLDPDVALIGAEPVGSVGLQMFFSDGHERGIYPWSYLHALAYGPAPILER